MSRWQGNSHRQGGARNGRSLGPTRNDPAFRRGNASPSPRGHSTSASWARLEAGAGGLPISCTGRHAIAISARLSETFDLTGLFSRDPRLPALKDNRLTGSRPQGQDQGVFEFGKLLQETCHGPSLTWGCPPGRGHAFRRDSTTGRAATCLCGYDCPFPSREQPSPAQGAAPRPGYRTRTNPRFSRVWWTYPGILGTRPIGSETSVSPQGLASWRSRAANASMSSGASNARFLRPTVTCVRIPAPASRSIAWPVA